MFQQLPRHAVHVTGQVVVHHEELSVKCVQVRYRPAVAGQLGVFVVPTELVVLHKILLLKGR